MGNTSKFKMLLPRLARPIKKGRPRLKGQRLPPLKQILQDSQKIWTKAIVEHWYGRYSQEYQLPITDKSVIEFVTGTAVWYHGGQMPLPIRWVLVRDPNQQFEPQVLLCTDVNADALDILAWYARRWTVEVTFHEVREHLGMETQRQWNDLAIARTTPVLLGSFALVTLLAHQLSPLTVNKTAWYTKKDSTFADALARVKRHL